MEAALRTAHKVFLTEFTDAMQHAFTDDAGMSKHRLSPYNAYYHN